MCTDLLQHDFDEDPNKIQESIHTTVLQIAELNLKI